MSLAIEIALGVVLGLWLADLLKKHAANRTHKKNIERYRKMLLYQDLSWLLSAALDGYDYLFTRSNRELLWELAGEKDESKRFALAESIAQDASERFYAMKRGERLPSVMSDADKHWLQGLKDAIHEGRVFREQMSAIRSEVGDETYETAKGVLKLHGYDLP